MITALPLLMLIAATLIALHRVFGYDVAFAIGFGAISMMSLMISVTFLWLWQRRATPLALGMSFSWGGAASLLGWYWMFHVLQKPAMMIENSMIFAFLALHLVGALHHFEVMKRSMGVGSWVFAMPVLAVALAGAVVQTLL